MRTTAKRRLLAAASLGLLWLSPGALCGAGTAENESAAPPPIESTLPQVVEQSSGPTAVAAPDYPLSSRGPRADDVAPPTAAELRTAISRGVEYLLQSQRSQGAWGGPQRSKGLNLYAPGMESHRAFRTAATSLAVEALLAARSLAEAEVRPRIDQAVDRGQSWLLEYADDLRRAAPGPGADELGYALYNVWGHLYALHALTALHQRAAGNENLQAQLLDALKLQVLRLERTTYVGGGWGYYDEVGHTMTPGGSSNSFVTAAALLALQKADQLGVKYPPKLIEKDLASIRRQRFPDFSYAYGEYLKMYPRLDINRPAGSLGRSQVCNLALRRYGDPLITDDVLRAWLERLAARNGWLSMSRKLPIPHRLRWDKPAFFSISGYFFYFGHYYAALCIEELPEADRPRYQDHLARILLPLQEKDGSWWDYPMFDYHQAWGTSMAVSTLVRCRHAEGVEPRKDPASAAGPGSTAQP